MKNQTRIHIGTSGFAYREWRGSFYPEDITAGGMLPHYSSRFKAVEINATFYRMPSRQVMEQWNRQVPDDFCFALKAPALITHFKKLIHVGDEIAAFVKAATGLGNHLGPILFQLPPSQTVDEGLLEEFLDLVAGMQASIEFRHSSWFNKYIYKILTRFGCSLCISDRDDQPEPELIRTARFGYLRLRRDHYDLMALRYWRERIKAQGWDDAFVFFKHDDTAEGTRLAEAFQRLP